MHMISENNVKYNKIRNTNKGNTNKEIYENYNIKAGIWSIINKTNEVGTHILNVQSAATAYRLPRDSPKFSAICYCRLVRPWRFHNKQFLKSELRQSNATSPLINSSKFYSALQR